MEKAEPVAYRIGLTPREFEELSPGEFRSLVEAYEARRKDEDYRRAYFVSLLMNPHLKEPISPEQIFDPLYYTADEIKEKKNRQAKDEAEYFKSFGKQKGRLGRRKIT